MMGKDRKTAYERRRGRKCQIPVVPLEKKSGIMRPEKGRRGKTNSLVNARRVSGWDQNASLLAHILELGISTDADSRFSQVERKGWLAQGTL